MNTRSACTVTALIALVLIVGGCGSGHVAGQAKAGAATPSTVPSANTANPVGVIAIGHSGLTGENSDPSRPGQVALENSWATGTSPQVNSIYRRLVAVRPETEGHVANTASGGAPASTLARQARFALETVPTPALVVVQTIDNDIRCDGIDREHVAEFGVAIADAVKVVTTASPDSRILMVGQLGRPPSSVRCDPDPSDALISIIEKYETEQARVCATVPNCRTDEGARAAYVERPESFSSDRNHLNVRGQAEAAEIAWPAVAALLELS
jgi:hypothetical protein